MEEGDGMSFAEFTYPLMQGWDWWHMYQSLGIQMQIGGSDQFGNILTGIETVKTVRESEETPHLQMPSGFIHDPVGFTVPLLTDSSGAKFGKSAGNAVWLDPFETSAFDLYGYFMRRPDEDLDRLLKLFTFLPLRDIQKLIEEHQRDPPKRLAHHTLAFEVLSLVHGADVAIRERQQHQMIFGGGGDAITLPVGMRPAGESDGETSPYKAVEGHPTVLNNAPKIEMQLPDELVRGKSMAKIIYAAGLTQSISEAHRLVAANGAYIGAAPGDQNRPLIPGNLTWTPVKLWVPGDVQKYLIDDKVILLRKGKHNVRVIEVVDDETWKNSGKTYPGEPYTGKVRLMMEQLKTRAKEEGKELSDAELRSQLDEAIKDLEEPISVVNNPDIKFPTRRELKEKLMADKAARKVGRQ
jgi:tyrosyl-tRNA synthetase